MQYELTMRDIFRYFADVTTLTGAQVFALFVPSLALIVLLHLASQVILKQSTDVFGWRNYLLLFGWLGIAVHELGHLLFCALFLHLVSDFKLFTRKPPAGKSYGWVDRTHVKSDFDNFKIGSFFIGAGPILLGATVIYFAGQALLGTEALASLQFPTIDFTIISSFQAFKAFAYEIVAMLVTVFRYFFVREGGTDWRFWLFLFIAFSVGSAMTLSWPDIRATITGLITIFVAFLILNVLTLWSGTLIQESIAQMVEASRSVYGMMLFVLMMNVFIAVIIMVLSVLISTLRGTFFRR